MANIYKSFGINDVASTRTLLHENIPITASVISSSTYGTSSVKTYTHGMFESIYDYPFASASANQLFDITVGCNSDSTASNQTTKKLGIYNQMSKVLLGLASDGTIAPFDDNGLNLNGTELPNLYFVNFSRLLAKDEIKKGTFSMQLGVGADTDATSRFSTYITLQDVSASTNYRTDSPTGEYSVLYVVTSSNTSNPVITGSGIYSISPTTASQGIIFYQAGIVALSPYIFANTGSALPAANFNSNIKGLITGSASFLSYSAGASQKVGNLFISGTVQESAEALRSRIRNISFNNTTELNSTIYFCRVHNNEFNYSSNPTYTSASQIVVKNGNALNAPVSYITTVGLYSSDDQLLAVAKLSEPIKKDPTQELILRVRLDY